MKKLIYLSIGFMLTLGSCTDPVKQCDIKKDTALQGCEETAISVHNQLEQCEYELSHAQASFIECNETLNRCDSAFKKCVIILENLATGQ